MLSIVARWCVLLDAYKSGRETKEQNRATINFAGGDDGDGDGANTITEAYIVQAVRVLLISRGSVPKHVNRVVRSGWVRAPQDPSRSTALQSGKADNESTYKMLQDGVLTAFLVPVFQEDVPGTSCSVPCSLVLQKGFALPS